jgi:hypothetical protein
MRVLLPEPLEPFAEDDEAPREGEEDDDEGERYEVHVRYPQTARGSGKSEGSRGRD